MQVLLNDMGLDSNMASIITSESTLNSALGVIKDTIRNDIFSAESSFDEIPQMSFGGTVYISNYIN